MVLVINHHPLVCIEVAKLAYADEFITSKPEGYHSMLGEKGISLSGGTHGSSSGHGAVQSQEQYTSSSSRSGRYDR